MTAPTFDPAEAVSMLAKPCPGGKGHGGGVHGPRALCVRCLTEAFKHTYDMGFVAGTAERVTRTPREGQ